MKKQLLGIFSLVMLCISGFAQINNYDISKYKLPDIQRKQLDLNVAFSDDNSYSKQDDREIIHNQFSNNTRLLYNDYTNTRPLQKEQTFVLYMDANISNYRQHSFYEYNNNAFNPQLYYSLTHRNYKTERTFIEWGINTDFTYSAGNQEGKTPNATTSDEYRELDYFINVPLKFGTGRIEQVQDARQAIYILDELTKANRITKNLGENEITEFANLISSLQNQRFFDYRLQKIRELAALDSFFREKSLIDETDILYFSTLNDFWQFGRQQIRKSGLRNSFVIYPGFSYTYLKDKTEHDYEDDNSDYFVDKSAKFTNLSINTGYEVIYEKPLSLSKQSSTEFSFLLGWIQTSEKDSDNKLKLPNAQLNFEQRFGIYPNTRTDFSWFFGGSMVKTFDLTDENDTDFGVEGFGAIAKTGLVFNYYISPQLRFNAEWNLNYTWQENDEDMYYSYFDLMDAEYILHFMTNSFNNYTDNINNQEVRNNFRIKLTYSFF